MYVHSTFVPKNITVIPLHFTSLHFASLKKKTLHINNVSSVLVICRSLFQFLSLLYFRLDYFCVSAPILLNRGVVRYPEECPTGGNNIFLTLAFPLFMTQSLYETSTDLNTLTLLAVPQRCIALSPRKTCISVVVVGYLK